MVSPTGQYKTYKRQKAETKQKSTPLIKKGLFKKIPWLKVSEPIIWAVLGGTGLVILSLSIDPWLSFAEHLVSENSELVFLNILTKIPIAGGLFGSLLGNSIKVVGCALFLFFNVSQIILLLATSNQVAMRSDKAQRIVVLSTIGYLAEGAVATMAHPPYQGGMGAFLGDLANMSIDPFYFNYGELAAVAGLLFAFEVFCWMGIVLIFAIREANKKRRAKA